MIRSIERRLGMTAAALAMGALVLGLAGCGSSDTTTTADSSTSAAASGVTFGPDFTQADCNRNKAAGTITYVAPGTGYTTGATNLDVFMGVQLGYFKDLCLNVVYTASTNNQQLVSSGKAQATAQSTAAGVMANVTNGANFIGVMTIENVSHTEILAAPGVTSLKQLEGKSIGYTSNVGATTLAMLHKAGVNINSIKFVRLTDRSPNVVQKGEVDAIVAGIGQPLQLDQMGVKYSSFSAQQLGVNGTGEAYVFNKTFEQAHPDVVADFLRADLKALDYCLGAGSADCVKQVNQAAAAHNLDNLLTLPVQTHNWAVETAFIKKYGTKPLGLTTPALWQPEYDQVETYAAEEAKIEGLGDAKPAPPLASMMDATLIPKIYDSNDKLIWP